MDEKKSWFSKTKTFMYQMIPVMLGVYLGIFAGNCNDARQQKELKMQVIQKIKGEIAENNQQITTALEYHERLRDSVEYFYKNTPGDILRMPVNEIEDGNIRYYWEGTKTYPLKNAGYQTAIVTGVLADMDFELVSLLSNIEAEQKNYEEMSKSYLNVIINKGSTAPLMDYASFVSFFSNDIVYVERELLASYQKVLKHIETIEH